MFKFKDGVTFSSNKLSQAEVDSLIDCLFDDCHEIPSKETVPENVFIITQARNISRVTRKQAEFMEPYMDIFVNDESGTTRLVTQIVAKNNEIVLHLCKNFADYIESCD